MHTNRKLVMTSNNQSENESNYSSDGCKKRGRESDDSSEKEVEILTNADSQDEEFWNDDLHRHLVSAVFEIGLRNASPAVILENMTEKAKAITSERVKSKLQKYRNNKKKSRQDFMEEYDAFLARMKAVGCAGLGTQVGRSPTALLEMMGCKKLLGGDAAAFLSYAVMNEQRTGGTRAESTGEGIAAMSSHLLRKDVTEYIQDFEGTGIPFPELSEEEKKTSLGVSLTFVMGLFLSMTQHLMSERSQAKQSADGVNSVRSDSPPVDQL